MPEAISSEAAPKSVQGESAARAPHRRRRVLFLINSLAGGGAERVMCTLLRHSEDERAEFEITLALLDDEPAAQTPPGWVDVRQLNCRKSALKSILAVRRLIDELKPDVTVSFLTRSNIANVLGASAPAVISERANTSAHFPNSLGGLVSKTTVRAIYPRAARVIAVSQGVADDLTQHYGVRPDRIATITNPVDIELLQARAGEPPVPQVGERYVLAAGRLIKSKNFDMLIRAFASSGIEGKLVIAGEGPERANLAETAHDAGVAERVLLPGFCTNPYALMRRARLFVLSSNAEGFPNAMVEAMAVGVPVIATNCASGPSEILAEAPRDSIHGLTFAKHGVLTPPNDVAALAKALRALDDDANRAAYAEKSQARARDFAAAATAKRYWQVVREALLMRS